MVDCLHRRAVVLDAVDIMLGTARTGDLFQLGAVGIVRPFDPVPVGPGDFLRQI